MMGCNTALLASCFRKYFCLSVLAMVAGADSGNAAEESRLDDALKSMSEEIAKYITSDSETQNRIMVGTFSGPGTSSAGPRISKGIKEYLEATEVNGAKVSIAQLGGYSVTGDYASGQRSGTFIVRIDAKIKDAQGNNVHQLTERVVTSLEDGLKIMGTTVNVSQANDNDDPPAAEAVKDDAEKPELDDKKIAEKIQSSLDHPSIHHSENVLFASKSSPYGIELLIKKGEGYDPVTPDAGTLATGFGLVDLESDQAFAIRLHNKTGRKVGVALTMDGINIFAFSKYKPWRDLGKLVIRPGEAIVKGWHEEGNVSREFIITNYGDSAAARFGATEGVGTLTATFYEILPTRAVGEFGVGFGDKTKMGYKSVPIAFGRVISSVSVKYLRPAHPEDLPPG